MYTLKAAGKGDSAENSPISSGIRVILLPQLTPPAQIGLQHQGKFMKPKARYTARYGQTVPQLLPPDLNSLGTLSFTSADFKALDAWLAEEG